MTSLAAGKTTRSIVPLVALVAACFWTIDLALLHAGTPHPLDDTWEYGLAARSLLAGHGFRTAMIHPPLWTLRDGALTVPVLVHGPLLPLLLAPPLHLLGAAALDGIAWLAALFAMLAAVLTARVATRLGGAGPGALAALAVTASPITLRMVHHDMAPVAGMLAVAAALDRLTAPQPRGAARGLALGVVLGLAALVRPELMLVVPLVGVALALEGRGAGRALVALVAGCVIVVTPWLVHTARAVGSPFFNLSSYLLIGNTSSHPDLSPMRDFGIPPARWPAALAASWPELLPKWAHFAPRALKHLIVAPSAPLGWLAVAGAWVAVRGRNPGSRLAGIGLAACVIPFALCTVTESSERYVAVFLPLWALALVRGVDALRASVAPSHAPARARALVAVALLASTAAALVAEARQGHALERWLAAERAALASRSDHALVARPLFSDTPDFAAWTTGRSALWLTADEYARLPDRPAADRPARGDVHDEWFHADLHAAPAPARGGTAAEITATGEHTRRPSW